MELLVLMDGLARAKPYYLILLTNKTQKDIPYPPF